MTGHAVLRCALLCRAYCGWQDSDLVVLDSYTTNMLDVKVPYEYDGCGYQIADTGKARHLVGVSNYGRSVCWRWSWAPPTALCYFGRVRRKVECWIRIDLLV